MSACRRCRTPYDSGAKYCQRCGAKTTQHLARAFLLAVGIFLAPITLIVAVGSVTTDHSATPSSTAAGSDAKPAIATAKVPVPAPPKETAKEERDDERAIQKLEERGRIEYAESLEDQMLDKGFDVTVEAYGPQHTMLRMKWILVSKVVAHQFSKNPEMFERMREMKFKKFTITDGYDSIWYWNL